MFLKNLEGSSPWLHSAVCLSYRTGMLVTDNINKTRRKKAVGWQASRSGMWCTSDPLCDEAVVCV